MVSEAFDRAVQAHLDHRASEDQLAVLRADEADWLASLWRHLDKAEERLDRARKEVHGPMRAAVLGDLDGECWRIDEVMSELIGPAPEPEARTPQPALDVGTTQLQLSWSEGRSTLR